MKNRKLFGYPNRLNELLNQALDTLRGDAVNLTEEERMLKVDGLIEEALQYSGRFSGKGKAVNEVTKIS
jgi:hypothetical protein